MADRLKDIPKLASNGSNLQAFAEAVREVLQTFRGYRGDPLDQALTLRFARDGGLVGLPGVGGGGGTIIIGGGGGGGGGGTYTPDLTPPPQPTGLAVTAGISHIYIAHDTPTYTVGNGHDRTIVYGSKWASSDPTPPTFGEAVELFTFQGNFGAYPSDPNTRWCIWIKWRTMDQVESTDPAGGTNGAQVTTGQDVTLLLEALTGEITETQLYAALGARINLIDASAGTAGSVNARIASEAATRTSADSALATSISLTSANVGVNAAAIAAETVARVALDGSVHALYTVRAEVTAGGRTVVGGFGLAATSTAAGGPQIDFGVRADRFWIGAPSSQTGVTDVLPFVVQAADQTVNGVLIPKGVYMNAAYINNLTAMIARLGTAWIDTAMIASVSAGKITTGALQVGANIQSTVYTPGAAGWIIRANGSAEFASASIRGTLTAGQLEAGIFQTDNVHTRGLTVRDGSGNIILAAGTPLNYANVGGATKPVVYRAVSRGGFGAVGAARRPHNGGLLDAATNAVIVSPNRSYVLCLLSRATGAVTSGLEYDVYDSGSESAGRDAAALAAALDATTSAQIVVLFTYDEPENLRTTGGLPAAIYRAGGTPGVFESSRFQSRGAYMLIALGGQPGSGNAFVEQYAGYEAYGADGPDDAWIDITFSVVNGNVVVGGGSSLFEINASNISTYMAAAAIGYAQIGSIDAGTITVGTLNVDRITNGDITQTFLDVSYSSVALPLGSETTVVGVNVTQPAGTSWVGDIVFSGEVYRAALAAQSGTQVRLYMRDTGGTWYASVLHIETFPAGSFTASQAVTFVYPWNATLPVGATVNRVEIRCTSAGAAGGVTYPSLVVRTYKK